MKRVLSVLLALCLLIGAVPVFASAEDSDFVIVEGVLKAYNGPGGDVVIPEEVSILEPSVFQGNSTITSISISNDSDLGSIYDWCFSGCTNLTTVAIPARITSIDYAAFNNCPALKDVYYGGSTGQWEKIVDTTDGLNDDLVSANVHCFITDPDLILVGSGKCGDDMTWMLDDQYTLTLNGTGTMYDYYDYTNNSPSGHPRDFFFAKKIIVSEGITEISRGAFYDSFCEEVILPSTLKKIPPQAFGGTQRLHSVSLPEALTEIGEAAFFDCRALTHFEIPAGVTKIDRDTFSLCLNLQTVTIPNTVTYIGMEAFYGCAISEITIPDSVTEIDAGAFYYNENLKSIKLSANLKTLRRQVFKECNSLTSVTLPASLVLMDEDTLSDSNLKDVYYEGTESQWKQIKIQPTYAEEGAYVPNDNSFHENGRLKIHFKSVPSTVDGFTDVPANQYYAKPVAWAVAQGVTNGKGGATTFKPGDNCTRAEIVTFLWRAMGKEQASAEANFTDMPSIGDFRKAISWAVENGVTRGKGGSKTFMPNDTCTRAEAVTFIWRAMDKPQAGANATFTDMPGTADFQKAISWAVENNVTKGKGATTFKPNDTCSRGEIVTFLYRAMGE